MLHPFLPHCECHPSAYELTRRSTIEDYLSRGRQVCIAVSLEPTGIDSNGAGNCHNRGGRIRPTLKIQNQNVFARVQLLFQLFRSDPCKPELMKKVLPAGEPPCQVEAKSRRDGDRSNSSYASKMNQRDLVDC